MSEVEPEGIRKFKTARHFTGWLRLAPNNKVSGGKLSPANLKDSTPLRDFFQRISFRKERVLAINATARKLAVILWNMVVKGVPYINPEGNLFLDQKGKLGLDKRIKK